MKTEAEVILIKGNIAVVRVRRQTMCDGCEKNSCEGSCSAAALMGAGKTVDAEAENPVGASIGDRVTLESPDKKILGFAAIVFILPIVICAAVYAAALGLGANEKYSIIAAFVSFALTFAVIGAIERRMRQRRPDIVITSIIRKGKTHSGDTD